MFKHYTEYIQRELTSRQDRNPNYSIRAFARDLDLAHQTLAAVLKKEHGISVATAKKIAPLLNLTSLEENIFVYSVQALHHRTADGRQRAVAELENLKNQVNQKILSQESFHDISSWEHNAILALVDLPGFSPEAEHIAQRLSIPKSQAGLAFQRLKELGLLELNSESKWRRTGKVLGFRSGQPSADFQNHYRQVLNLASEKIDTVSVSEREMSTVFMSLAPGDYDYILKELSNFRKKLLQEVARRGGESNSVYCLSFQLFPVAGKDSP